MVLLLALGAMAIRRSKRIHDIGNMVVTMLRHGNDHSVRDHMTVDGYGPMWRILETDVGRTWNMTENDL